MIEKVDNGMYRQTEPILSSGDEIKNCYAAKIP
jgi:hypothetical protein